MRLAQFVVVVLLVLVSVAWAPVTLAQDRVALVVGNSAYAHTGRLTNPKNDATDVSSALRRIGFEVTMELDADRVELTEGLRGFTRRSVGADIALVFYAGHGLEMDGLNYLLPVDARLERDTDVRYEAVTLDDVLEATTGASLRLVILDACRNNPLARSMQRMVADRNVSPGSLGAPDEAWLSDEVLVAYGATAGTTAADGTGRNSPYTSALLSYLEEPLEVLTLFRRVRADVLRSTKGEQRPHEYQSLQREHYLSELPAAPSAAVGAAASVTHLDLAELRLMAEFGDAEAQTELGERYEDGRGVGQDYGVAVSWFRRSAVQGHAPAQAALGYMYADGRGVEQDDKVAVSWYRRAARQGNARGKTNLGVMYQSGRGESRDDAEAVRWFRLAAEQGDPGGQTNLGFMYRNGLGGLPQDDAEAVRWFRLAADAGDPHAQNHLALEYRAGRGVLQDDAEAVRWFRLAAEQGLARAQTSLGYMYRDGRGVARDAEEAVWWYRLAAEQGHALAQYNMGYMYHLGSGVPQQTDEAIRWYRLASEQRMPAAAYELARIYEARSEAEVVDRYRRAAVLGSVAAQNDVGVMYRDGRGVSRDDEEAVEWFRLAADQEDPGGRNNLGVMYRDGRGISRDDEEAVRWFRLAADQGHPGAQYNLGVMYRDGRGVSQDDGEAVRWFRLAAPRRAGAKYSLAVMYEQGRGVPRDRQEALERYESAARSGHVDAQRRLRSLGIAWRPPGNRDPFETMAEPGTPQWIGFDLDSPREPRAISEPREMHP